MKPLLLLLLLVACNAGPSAPDTGLSSLPPPEVRAVSVPAPDKPVPLVVRKFDKATSREIPAVLSPDITAEQVSAIRAADNRSRQALTKLGLQGTHASEATKREAMDAVRALEALLPP